jgi:hypothetical protein
MSEQVAPGADEIIYCHYHPNTPTTLRCNRCGKPICARDAVRTPVGYRCKDCVRRQQDVFFNATVVDYVIAAIVALPVGFVAQQIAPRLGFFIIFIGPAIGGIVGEVIFRATRKRRGRYSWAVAVGAISAGALAALWPKLQLLFLVGGEAFGLIVWDVVFFVLMAGAVVARLRIWR